MPDLDPVQLPVFYINLASRPDRRAFMEGQFQRLGIRAERFDAVTPQTSDPHWVALARDNLGPGELACTLSHRAIWALMAARGLDAALVLEDDMVLAATLPALVRNWRGGELDLLRIETRNRSMTLGRPVEVAGIGARQMLSHEIGSGGYVMTLPAVPRLIDDPLLAVLPIDKFLFGREGPCLRRERIVVTCPALAQPRALSATAGDTVRQSNIADDRIARAAPAGPRTVAGRLGRVGTNLRHASLELVHAARSGALGSLTRRSIPFAGALE